jgi:hypothetical protein
VGLAAQDAGGLHAGGGTGDGGHGEARAPGQLARGEAAATRPLDDPWAGIVDTCRIRTELGYRPLYPTLYTAQAAGAL